MKRWMSLLLAVCLLFSAAGCSYFSTKTPGEGATINYHLPQLVTSIDPQTVTSSSARTVVHALYEGLCRVNAGNELLPGVAERWDHNADYTEFTFTLRENAAWRNGDPVTADDFVFAFTRALDPNTGSQDVHDLFCIKNAQAVYRGEKPASSLGAVAVDTHTLRITLEDPDENFPYKTAQTVYMPCNRAFFEQTKGRYGLTYSNSCTNGPFCFVNRYSWEERKSMSLCASSSYTGVAVVMPEYIQLTMGSTGAYENPLTALLDGTVDMCDLPAEKVAAAEEAGCAVSAMENVTGSILLNPADEVLAVEEIRTMMFAALNSEKLAELVGEHTTQNIVPASVVLGGAAYRAQVDSCVLPAYNPAAAANLSAVLEENQLESIGSMMILCADDPVSKGVANELVIVWNNMFGTYFNILPLEESELQSRVQSGDYQICIAGVTAQAFEPYSFLMQVAQLCPEESLLEMLQSADTPAELYAAEQALLDKGLVYPLWNDVSYFAQAPQVSGAYVHALTALEFTDVLKYKK